MSGADDRIFRQGEKFCFDTVHQDIKIASRKVGPSDGIPEQHIPGDHESLLRLVKTEVPPRVSGCVQNLKRGVTPGNFIAIFEKPADLRHLSQRKTK